MATSKKGQGKFTIQSLKFVEIFRYAEELKAESLTGLYNGDSDWLHEILYETKNQSFNELPSLMPLTPSAIRKINNSTYTGNMSKNDVSTPFRRLEKFAPIPLQMDTIMEEESSSFSHIDLPKKPVVASTPFVKNIASELPPKFVEMEPISKIQFNSFHSGGNIARPVILKPVNAQKLEKPMEKVSKPSLTSKPNSIKNNVVKKPSLSVKTSMGTAKNRSVSRSSAVTRSKIESAADRVARERTERAREQKVTTDKRLADAKKRREELALEKQKNRMNKVRGSLNTSEKSSNPLEAGRRLILGDSSQKNGINHSVATVSAPKPSNPQFVRWNRTADQKSTTVNVNDLKNMVKFHTNHEIAVNKENAPPVVPPLAAIHDVITETSESINKTFSVHLPSETSSEKKKKIEVSNYEITPQRPRISYPPPKVPSYASSPHENSGPACYGINDLGSGDDTDDEDNPRKPIPKWAKDAHLWKIVSVQFKNDNMIDAHKIFGTIKPLDLNALFNDNRPALRTRTSSAIWDSPLLNSRETKKVDLE